MSPGTTKNERRKKKRDRPPSLIYVELGSANGGMMRDLSEEGFALRAMMPLRAGEKTPFSFSLNDSVQIAGEGEILWVEENGRVAGIRFTEISSRSLQKVNAWLNGKLESLKDREAAEKSANEPHPDLAQLREEIRSGPVGEESREAVRPVLHASAQEKTFEVTDLVPRHSYTENTPTESPVPASNELVHHPPHEIVIDSPAPTNASPVSSGLSSETAPIEPAFEPLPHDPSLPDISEVLIQPHRLHSLPTPNETVLEPLSDAQPPVGRFPANWMEWFTASRAITIMFSLALLVGISAFHRAVGGILISLGEAMGGRQSTQVAPTGTRDEASSRIPSEVATRPAEAPQPSSPLPEPVTTNRESVPNSDAASGSPQADNSSTLRTATPPITPLSGITAQDGSDVSLENGQSEYLRAMQLLRNKAGGADTAEAVRLLWASVQKGNPSAEVALADLFWHGQGVAHNCDQTRILLSAAARKGSAEAQRRLQQFQREGCE